MLELFSGVGGMHITADIAAEALKDTVIIVIDAVDINTVTNDICKHNHPTTNHMQRYITGINVKCSTFGYFL